MRNIILFCSLFCILSNPYAQNRITDRISTQVVNEKIDSNKVRLLNDLAYAYSTSNPAKGILTAQEAYTLAQKINLPVEEIRALSFMANSYNNIGDYNKALEMFLRKEALAEKANLPENIAGSLINIGIIYTQQQDYKRALPYYLKADSIIKANKIVNLVYYSFQNLGDLYDRLNKNDSALFYYNKAFQIASNPKSENLEFMGASHIGLGNCFVKENDYVRGKLHYQLALSKLSLAKDDDLFCEGALNLANLHLTENHKDSAIKLAWEVFKIAEKDSLPSRLKDASIFLSNFYKSAGKYDSAL